MLLLEHEGKAIFRERGINVPRGALVRNVAELDDALSSIPFPVMVKAQALTGGRGKAGAVLAAADRAAAADAVRRLLGSTVKGLPVAGVLVEERLAVERELYLAVTLDAGSMILLFGAEGGVEVESCAAALERIAVDPLHGLGDDQVRTALERLGLPAPLWPGVTAIASHLFGLFRALDATLAEINPLAVLGDGSLAALDARIDIDDGALFRQPRLAAIRDARPKASGLEGEMQALDIQYLALGGPVGLLSSGAGCGVAIMDWVAAEGSRLAAFVDIDYALLTGKTEEAMRLVLRTYAADPTVRAVIVNFTTCGLRLDEIADALVAVLDELALGKPVFIHLEGNRVEAGRARIRASRHHLSNTIGEAVRAACRAAGGIA